MSVVEGAKIGVRRRCDLRCCNASIAGWHEVICMLLLVVRGLGKELVYEEYFMVHVRYNRLQNRGIGCIAFAVYSLGKTLWLHACKGVENVVLLYEVER